MVSNLTPELDETSDLMLTNGHGGAQVIIFIDYCDQRMCCVHKVVPKQEVYQSTRQFQMAVIILTTAEPKGVSDIAGIGAIVAHKQGLFGQALLSGPFQVESDLVPGFAAAIECDVEQPKEDIRSEHKTALLKAHASFSYNSFSPQNPGVFIDGQPFVHGWDSSAISTTFNHRLSPQTLRLSNAVFQCAVSAGFVLFGVMLALNLVSVYSGTAYLIIGAFLWYFAHEVAVHVTLPGVLTAALLKPYNPANPKGVALHACEVVCGAIDSHEVGSATSAKLEAAVDSKRERRFHLQHALENCWGLILLPMFAVFNTGLLLVGANICIFAREIFGTSLGLVIGKPLGISVFVWMTLRRGFARLLPDIFGRELFGASVMCSVGFTMSIIIASDVFLGQQLVDARLSILAASIFAAVVGAAVLMSRSAAICGKET